MRWRSHVPPLRLNTAKYIKINILKKHEKETKSLRRSAKKTSFFGVKGDTFHTAPYHYSFLPILPSSEVLSKHFLFCSWNLPQALPNPHGSPPYFLCCLGQMLSLLFIRQRSQDSASPRNIRLKLLELHSLWFLYRENGQFKWPASLPSQDSVISPHPWALIVSSPCWNRTCLLGCWGFPGDASSKESTCQCGRRKRHGFHP